MARTHYHVLGGLHGYMPNLNEAFSSRRSAQNFLAEEIAEERDQGGRFRGSLAAGYFEAENFPNGAGNEYYEITECDEADCLEPGGLE